MKLVCVQILRAALLLSILFASFTVHTADQFVYTNNDIQGPNKVLGFRVGADGTLSEIVGSPFPTAGSGGDGCHHAENGRLSNLKRITGFLYRAGDHAQRQGR